MSGMVLENTIPMSTYNRESYGENLTYGDVAVGGSLSPIIKSIGNKLMTTTDGLTPRGGVHCQIAWI